MLLLEPHPNPRKLFADIPRQQWVPKLPKVDAATNPGLECEICIHGSSLRSCICSCCTAESFCHTDPGTIETERPFFIAACLRTLAPDAMKTPRNCTKL